MIMIPIMILSTHLVQGAFVPCDRGALWSLCSIIALRSGSTCSVIGDCFFFDDVDSLHLGAMAGCCCVLDAIVIAGRHES